MGAIFISYRREDSEGHAGRLFEDLVQRFGKDSVFIDVSGIEPGRDFRKVIDAQVGHCSVLLALIGSRWLEAADEHGARRIDDPADFVRLETASALKRDIPVVPVLVHGARMPTAEQLPSDLTELAYRNAVELTHARWESDVQVLADALAPHVGKPLPPPPVPVAASSSTGSRRLLIGAVAATLVAAAGAATWYAVVDAPRPPPAPAADDQRAVVERLIAEMNAADIATRKAATTRLVREFGNSPVAIALAVDQLGDGTFQGLSREGRVNVLTYLAESNPKAWRETDLREARASLARIQARLAAGTATLGPQVLQLVEALSAKLSA
ncbi:MAG TPA: toll/interleukin-1 receptor domain-containing protein [Albitalea sp.]|uniref:toll/interleukin-1 receptor domain-containing protein n=1 Tax=Piscinibacter sp. TaxID=1903157 RepID=UPI002ED198A6